MKNSSDFSHFVLQSRKYSTFVFKKNGDTALRSRGRELAVGRYSTQSYSIPRRNIARSFDILIKLPFLSYRFSISAKPYLPGFFGGAKRRGNLLFLRHFCQMSTQFLSNVYAISVKCLRNFCHIDVTITVELRHL